MQGKWFDERSMIVRIPADASTCRSKGPEGVEAERMYDSVVVCNGVRSNVRRVEVTEDLGSKTA